MKQVTDILQTVSRQHNIRILYACETGSRAWGFPSPDSDFDVRFIYMHEPAWYLSLVERKDSIEHMQGDLDVTGWDLRKALLLLKRSNAPLVERFQSPVRYFTDETFATGFRNLIEWYYSPTAVFYHHISLARKFYNELAGVEEIKLKSYFYMIRSLLSCYWIVADPSVLPMHMEGLLAKIEPGIAAKLRALVQLKAGVGEKFLYKRDPVLDRWAEELLVSLDAKGAGLAVNNEPMDKLDDFFLKMINAYADH